MFAATFAVTLHKESLYNPHAECWHSLHGFADGQNYAKLNETVTSEEFKNFLCKSI
jgi:hypothetical protein